MPTDKSPAQVADEALGVEAHRACTQCSGAVFIDSREENQYTCEPLHDAIDLAIAARAVEVCEEIISALGGCASNPNLTGVTVSDIRARLRAELDAMDK